MNINSGKPLNNLVLIKPFINNDKHKFASGGYIYIDTSYEPEMHAEVVGEVVRIPETVFLRKGRLYLDEDKRVPVEIQVGDIAYYNYLAIRKALTEKFDGKAVIENKELYVLISYENIFMVIRDGVPHPINDYLLIEPTYDEMLAEKKKCLDAGLDFPVTVEEEMKKNTQYGIVRYAGTNLSQNNGFSDEDLKVGSKVIIAKFADIPLEYEAHQTFEVGKTLFRVKRSDVLMVLE